MNKLPTLFFHPKRIFVQESIKDSYFCQAILSRFNQVEKEYIQDTESLFDRIKTFPEKKWNNSLVLTEQRGPFIRLCPGTQKHLCCLYHNLDVAAGCNLGCTYCILQGYINNPLITFYCNLDDMFIEMEQKVKNHPRQFYRIGTGELSDSLTFDNITHLGRELVQWFANQKNAIIELKSKNVHVEDLLGLKHNRRAVISWSMNSEQIWKSEEWLTSSISDRLLAATEVQDAGYRIGFHFDPMIEHEGWKDGYKETVDKIFAVIRPENIAWISLGALRYPAGFDEIIRANFPESRIVLGELLPGKDNKLRYFKTIRIEMFKKMFEWIRSYSQEVFVYLCMESKLVWEKSFGWSPKNSAALARLLDNRVK